MLTLTGGNPRWETKNIFYVLEGIIRKKGAIQISQIVTFFYHIRILYVTIFTISSKNRKLRHFVQLYANNLEIITNIRE